MKHIHIKNISTQPYLSDKKIILISSMKNIKGRHCISNKLRNFAQMKISPITYHLLLLLTLTIAGRLPAFSLSENPGAAIKYKTQGDAYYNAGRYSEALEYYTLGLDQAKKENNNHIYNACMGNIGNIYGIMEDYNRSLYYFKKGYLASEKEHDVEMMGKFTINIVAAYCLMNDAENAKVFFRKQMQLPVKNVKMRRYFYLYNQGLIAEVEKKYSEATYYMKQALEYVLDTGLSAPYLITQYTQMGEIALEQDRPHEAIRQFQRARKILSRTNQKENVNVYRELSQTYQKIGMEDSARFFKSMYLNISDSIFNRNQFNIANNKLFDYENRTNDETIHSLISRNHLQLAVILLFLFFITTLLLLYSMLRRKTHRLQEAWKLLVDKNEELMKSDRKSKRLLEQYIRSMNDKESPTGKKTEETDRNAIGLDQEHIDRLLNKINSIMEDIQIISSSDFNLNKLAEMAESNTRYVSWIINDTYGKNFKTFLNEYRIREACKRLADTEHYGNMTLQAIYEDLGYNSAASFIQAFKNVNGMTPSTYQRLARQKRQQDKIKHL